MSPGIGKPACLFYVLLVLAAPASSNKAPVCNTEDVSQGIDGHETTGLSMLQVEPATPGKSARVLLNSAQMQTEAQQLSDRLQKIAGRSPSPTREFLHSFQLCGQCSQFERFGEPNDGGYITCLDGLKDNLRAAYSMGVEFHDRWSDDVAANFGVPVNQFDCTVDQGTGCSTCNFFKKCITGHDNHEGATIPSDQLWTLRETLENTGQADAPKGSLLMKMDIDGPEWSVYEAAHPDTLAKFKEIIVEFHGLDQIGLHPQYLSAVQNLLDAGFQVTHLHGNNYAGMAEFGGDTIPNVLEVTFVQGAEKRRECLKEQEYLPLDDANRPGAPELPMAKLN